MTKILTCSIPDDLAQFLDENTDLSPSKILQSKLFEIKQNTTHMQIRLDGAERRAIEKGTKLSKLITRCNEIGVFEKIKDVLD